MRLAPLALLVACSGPSESTGGTDTDTVPTWQQHDTDTTTTDPPTDGVTDTDTTTVPPTGSFNGTVPTSPLPPPSFVAVTNRDGTPRTPADLVGRPTAMWFYPAANTGG